MADSVIGKIAIYFVAVERDRTLASRASAVVGMRSVIWVGGKIPQERVSAPIPGGANDDPSNGRRDPERFVHGPCYRLLGEIQVLGRVFIMHLGQDGDVAAVQVKGGAIDILAGLGICQDR